MQKIRIAAILISTMTVLVPVLSRTPRTSTQVINKVMTSAGMLKMPPGEPGAGNIGYAIAGGRWNPNMLSERSCKYAENPTATLIFATAYSRIRSQPITQANSSPRIAYAYVYDDPATGIIDASSA